jgi:hypothetical protein
MPRRRLAAPMGEARTTGDKYARGQRDEVHGGEEPCRDSVGQRTV